MFDGLWFGKGKIRFTVDDELGRRTLVVPDAEKQPWSGEPTEIIRDIEVRTRTRLKNGGNPIQFIRAYTNWRDRRDNNTVTFAEFCLRRYSQAIDVLDKAILRSVGDMLSGRRPRKRRLATERAARWIDEHPEEATTWKAVWSASRLKSWESFRRDIVPQLKDCGYERTTVGIRRV